MKSPSFIRAPLLAGILCCAFAPPAFASIQGWFLQKGQDFWQDLDSDPSAGWNGGWFARVELRGDEAALAPLTSVTLVRSGGSEALERDSVLSRYLADLRPEGGWENQAAMNSDLPNSFAYQLRWTSPLGGTRVSTLGPWAADNYPSAAPRIRNLAQLQGLMPDQAFTIEWDAMPNGTENDWIQVVVWGLNSQQSFLVAESPWVGQAGALDGRATSFTVPSGLPPSPGGWNRNDYGLSISFVKVMNRDNTTLRGAVGLGGFVKRTGAAITVAMQPCAVTLGATNINIGSSEGGGFLRISTTGEGCGLEAEADASWLGVYGFSFSDSFELPYWVEENTDANFRIATITVGDLRCTVTQAPAGYGWHLSFGWIYSAGSDWYYSPSYGWIWFHPDRVWLYSTSLNGWLASTDPASATLWTPQFRWLTPSAEDPHYATTTSIGAIYVGQHGSTSIPVGWVYSPRFGWVWPNGDGTWFYSSSHGWLGVNDEGGIFSVNEDRWL